jgi:subtilase family serine protease
MDNAPEEVLAAYPINDWINFNNFSANAQWQAGAGYIKKQGNRVGDTLIALDCTNVSSPVYTTGTSLTPCQFGATLDNFFPISLRTNFPYETDFADDGAISAVQGVRMWVASAPLPLASSAIQAYRVFYEMNGNVYMGMLEKDGAPYNYQQADGSVVNYLVTLNQAAVNSVQQGVITGTVAPGSQAGSSAEVGTIDLFGIGGHGVNGSLSPADLLTHYNVPARLNGAGQTIVIIDPPGSGDVADDLNVFSQYYNLPQCNSANPCLQHIDLSNGAAVSSSNDAGREIELDTQMAHGMAPAAKIILITAASNSWTDLTAAMNYAAGIAGATTVSMSFSGNPGAVVQQNEDSQLAAFQARGGPVFFASSGDSGYLANAQYPASSPYVTAVGGTRINAVQWISPASEVAWQYSSGGASPFAPMPAWQSALLSAASIAANNGMRAIPDVAAVADPQHSAVGTYFKDSWSMAGGTSASAPIWAGIGALFGQYLANEGKSLPALISATAGGFNGMIYRMKLTQGGASGFYDILSGSNNLTTNPCAICTATAGYDNVTGLGAPDATSLFSNF